VSEPLINGIFLVAGVVLGFILGEIATRRRAAEESERQKYSVHTMLRQEIDTNLDRLREWWGRVNRIESEPGRTVKELLIIHAKDLVEQPTPQWSCVRWERLSMYIPTALSPKRVREIGRVHETLTRIARLHARLAELSDEERDKLQAVRESKPGSNLFAWASQFGSDARLYLWTQLEADVKSLLDSPNPLPELPMPKSKNVFSLLRRTA
jgi:hypothetical protein